MGRIADPAFRERLKRQITGSVDIFGTPVEWRRYISSSGGQPELGIGDSACFQPRPSTWIISTPTIEEIQSMGGEVFGGEYMVQSVEQIDARDEMKLSGRNYRCVTQVTPARVGGDLYYRAIFRLSKSTGKF